MVNEEEKIEEFEEQDEKILDKSNGTFKILVIVLVILAVVYMIFHLYNFINKELTTVSKTDFSDSDIKIIENETGIVIPDIAYISEVEFSNDT